MSRDYGDQTCYGWERNLPENDFPISVPTFGSFSYLLTLKPMSIFSQAQARIALELEPVTVSTTLQRRKIRRAECRPFAGAAEFPPGKRLSTCSQMLVIQKAFLQRFKSYELLSVIKLLGFCYFFSLRDYLQ